MDEKKRTPDFTIKRQTVWISRMYGYYWQISSIEPKWNKDFGRWDTPDIFATMSEEAGGLVYPGLKLPRNKRDLIQIDPDGKVTGYTEVPDAQ